MMPADDPLRILHIERDPRDTERAHSLLEEAGLPCVIARVDAPAALLEALDADWHLVLADDGIPELDGRSVLDLVRERRPDLPFLIFSDAFEEGRAIETLTRGAVDYVLKEQPGRLAPCVQRAIRVASLEAARRQAEVERERLVHQLRTEGTFLNTVLRQVQVGIVIAQASSRTVTLANDEAERILGCFPVGRSVAEVLVARGLHAEDERPYDLDEWPIVRTLRDGEATVNEEILFDRLDGERRVLLVSATPIRDQDGEVEAAVMVLQDATSTNELETRLAQATKLESLGQLAGAVAHDFKNVLTAVVGFSDLGMTHSADEQARSYFAQIRDAGERATELTGQLLAFSRRRTRRARVVDVDALLEKGQKLLDRLIGERVRVAFELCGAGRVRVDPVRLEQIILNLSVNARDAMPRGGTLMIETATVELDEAHCRLAAGSRPGPHAKISVTDTGFGMDDATLQKIFEPFFTTKGEGSGTGLGLATVSEIVEESGGHLTVYSEVGRGTVFTVYLPIVADDGADDVAPSPFHRPARGNETILLVEDDDQVRRLARVALEKGGWQVLEAANGEGARRLAERHGDEIDLLVADVILPRMSGCALAHRICSTRSWGALFISGYDEESLTEAGLDTARGRVVRKPFRPETLRQRVRESIDAGRLIRPDGPADAPVGEPIHPSDDERRDGPGADPAITVLLADDSLTVRQYADEVLREAGFEVHLASGVLEAVELFDRFGSTIDLVLSDVTMPDGDGPALVGQLRERGFGGPAIFLSGHGEEDLRSRGDIGDDERVIEKPFMPDELVAAVRDGVRRAGPLSAASLAPPAPTAAFSPTS